MRRQIVLAGLLMAGSMSAYAGFVHDKTSGAIDLLTRRPTSEMPNSTGAPSVPCALDCNTPAVNNPHGDSSSGPPLGPSLSPLGLDSSSPHGNSPTVAIPAVSSPAGSIGSPGIDPSDAGNSVVPPDQAIAVSEPNTLALFGLVLAALGLIRRRHVA